MNPLNEIKDLEIPFNKLILLKKEDITVEKTTLNELMKKTSQGAAPIIKNNILINCWLPLPKPILSKNSLNENIELSLEDSFIKLKSKI